ncbi:hypothetical protein myaer102_37130 [Microcystis viridis NIES-102]|uniref:DUF5615 domain-containing protein n=2 Tax=Microcystis TaxID=1125 RepID=A0A3G9JSP2_MICVR|nr:hypothetical protein [Microcystis viridis]BBH41121.1 hypothetical protein myaer102_37130 [Microcystis viridis NIES-102]
MIFTQDSDFLIEASRRQTEGIEFIGVVYGHQLIVSIGDCIRDLELIAKLGKSEEFINIIQYLPLQFLLMIKFSLIQMIPPSQF